MNFIVYGLPRSRTFWLSRFLSYGDWNCGHDELRHLRSMDDVKSWFAQPNTGTVETAAAPWWRLVPPGVRVAVVRRPIHEVMESLSRLDVQLNKDATISILRRLDRKLDQIESRVAGAISVSFSGLDDEHTCAELFEHCLSVPHDTAWWSAMARLNLQCDASATFRDFADRRHQIERLAALAKSETIDTLRRRR